jgi:small subunit ribosomal protein S20
LDEKLEFSKRKAKPHPVCYSAAPLSAHAYSPRLTIKNRNLMANTKQARHRARQSTVRNAHNSAQRSRLRTAVKSVRKAIESGDKKAALETLNQATSVIDAIADKKVVHKNTASRNKSRLAAAVKSMS